MELNRILPLLGLMLVSCQWFDPRDIEVPGDWQPHLYVNVSMDSDSTHCSLSTSFGMNDDTGAEAWLEACARLESASAGLHGEHCGAGKAGGLGIWVPTAGLESLAAGDSLSLAVTTNLWGDWEAQAEVPLAPAWNGMTLDVRSYAEGDKVFDEFWVSLQQEEGDQKWHLIQLILQVDTVGARAKWRNLRSDDPNAVLRKHGDSMLDNAILLGAESWAGNEYDLHFRSRNNVDVGVPYHYVVLVQSVSEELFEFWNDLETVRRGEAIDVSGNVQGADGCLGVTRSASQLVFP